MHSTPRSLLFVSSAGLGPWRSQPRLQIAVFGRPVAPAAAASRARGARLGGCTPTTASVGPPSSTRDPPPPPSQPTGLTGTAALTSLPTLLTYVRLLAVPALAAVLLHPIPYAAQPAAAAAVFAAAAVTDWIDGYLARRLEATSAFGAFLDPVADKLMVCTAFVCLAAGVGGWGRPAVIAAAAVTVCREVGVSALREWMAEVGARGVVRVGFAGKVKTTVQMVGLTLLLGCWGGWARGGVWGGLWGAHVGSVCYAAGVGGVVLAAALAVSSGLGYLRAAWPFLLGKEVSR
ncbi:hypothetical protein MMPV_002681 [Pyropia vietnamensis]